MKARIAIVAACAGMFALAQTDLAQADPTITVQGIPNPFGQVVRPGDQIDRGMRNKKTTTDGRRTNFKVHENNSPLPRDR